MSEMPAGRCNQSFAIVLDQHTVSMASRGGQVGDSGEITDGRRRADVQVVDKTEKASAVIDRGICGRVTKGTFTLWGFAATRDRRRRAVGTAIRRAHSATHILHHALHEVIGETATQRGSKVEGDALRFDFAHKQAMTADEIRRVEDIVNAKIAGGSSVVTELLPISEAKSRGAMALFGEKYPDEVRVVTMGDFSVELCGGTHLTNTGQVGLCRITSEEPVAKGVRRISAVTGARALQKGRETDELMADIQRLVKATKPGDIPTRISSLQQQVKDLTKQLAEFTKASVSDAVGDLAASAQDVNGVKLVTKKLENVSRDALRDFVDQLRDNHGPIAVVLGAEIDGKVALIAAVSKSLVKDRKMNAGAAVKAAAQVAGGGGGGRPDMAEAGAKLVDKIEDALAAGLDVFQSQLA